jgi:hypothetical protein
MTSPASFRITGGDGREYGPVDLATLQQWAREGRVARAMRVWDSRTGNWVPAEQVPELAPLFGVAPPVAPPLVTPPQVAPVAPPVVPRTNALAVWSFAMAMVGLFCCGCLSLPAVILGAISLAQINTRHEGGRGLAIAGIVVGIAALALAFLSSLIMFFCSGHWKAGHYPMRFI